MIKEVLFEDIVYFDLKLDRLCNLIVKEMGYSNLLELHNKLNLERKLVINFNLNERNTKYFKDMVDLSDSKSEAEFLRSLLSTYSNFHPFLREMIINRNKFERLEEAIRKNFRVRVEIEGMIKEIVPLGFARDEETKYAVLRFQYEKNSYEQRVKDIEILKI